MTSCGEPLRGPFGSDVIRYRSEAFAWSGGFLTGGFMAAVFSFWPRRRSVASSETAEVSEK